MSDAKPTEPSIAHCCGQFIGHIVAACQTKVADGSESVASTTHSSHSAARTVRAAVTESTQGGVTYRRIVVDQVIDGDSTRFSPEVQP